MIYESKEIKLDYSKLQAPDTGYVPHLEIMIPNDKTEVANYTPKRPTVLVLPGGGYSFCSEREADPIAVNFLANGINAAVLYYSVAPSVYPSALLEALSAIKYLRENAERFYIDPDKIYVCGFSAGGHLAACTGTHWNKKEAVDYFGDVEAVKPNGLILSYPVIINDAGISHQGSFQNLLGDRFGDEKWMEYTCLDKQVSKDTPPTFIWSTFQDDAVPCESTLRFASALRANGVPFEMHIYEKGGHGASTGDYITCGGTPGTSMRLKSWLKEACDWVLDSRLKIKK